jgi:16S rRNA (adenine1518-N6/adenine1519-N6)-dimethyltransferase
MPLYRPVELMQFLDSLGQAPKRTMSQNFLVDGNIVAKIMREVESDSVVEIGSGPGVLTEAFLAAGKRVIAIEKDSGFAHALHRFANSNLTCHEADVLQCPLEMMIPQGADIVSNLPYHLTTPILECLLPLSRLFSKAVLMVQDEFAKRLLNSLSVLSLTALFYCELRYAFFVPKTCFWPRPKVNSAVITLIPKSRVLLDQKDRNQFFSLIQSAFSQKRKTVLHTISGDYSRESILDAFNKLGYSQTIRPEELKLEGWIALFCALKT